MTPVTYYRGALFLPFVVFAISVLVGRIGDALSPHENHSVLKLFADRRGISALDVRLLGTPVVFPMIAS